MKTNLNEAGIGSNPSSIGPTSAPGPALSEAKKEIIRMITNLGPSTGAEKQAKRLSAMPSSLRPLFVRAYAKNCSPRAAVKAFCIECQGYDRAAVTACTAYACPLWRFRPFQKPSKTT